MEPQAEDDDCFTCDQCGLVIETSVRYHCTVCDDYDLCEECGSGWNEHPPGHRLDKIMSEQTAHPVDNLEDELRVVRESMGTRTMMVAPDEVGDFTVE